LALLEEFDVALTEVIDFSFKGEADTMYAMTASVKRKLRQLVTRGFEIFRDSGAKKMTMDHVKAAYSSPQFSAMREDVEALLIQAATHKRLPGRSDLWCPLGVEFNSIPFVKKTKRDDANQRETEDYLKQSMTKPERGRLGGQSKGKPVGPAEGSVPDAKTGKPPRRCEADAATVLQDTLEHSKES
jgi:hypothetical protein